MSLCKCMLQFGFILLLIIGSANPWSSCPKGSVSFPGSGSPNTVILNGGSVASDGSIVSAAPNGERLYLGTSCDVNGDKPWDNLLNVKPLGKILSYTVDLSSAGCTCNAALYLVSMAQQRAFKSKKATCKGDPTYCDANSVCGSKCSEIDLMEANNHAFVSTLHKKTDPNGVSSGYGGGEKDWHGPRAWSAKQYGPGASCIDTRHPFNVALTFDTDKSGNLAKHGVEVVLSQGCSLTTRVGAGYNGLVELSNALRNGMTLVLSYWGGGKNNLSWLDGKGADNKGPCPYPGPKNNVVCHGTVKVRNLKVEPINKEVTPQINCPAGQFESSSSCKSCSEGHFQPTAGQKSCLLCGVGKYQSQAGKSKCESCNSGFFQERTGQAACVKCSSAMSTLGATRTTTCPALPATWEPTSFPTANLSSNQPSMRTSQHEPPTQNPSLAPSFSLSKNALPQHVSSLPFRMPVPEPTTFSSPTKMHLSISSRQPTSMPSIQPTNLPTMSNSLEELILNSSSVPLNYSQGEGLDKQTSTYAKDKLAEGGNIPQAHTTEDWLVRNPETDPSGDDLQSATAVETSTKDQFIGLNELAVRVAAGAIVFGIGGLGFKKFRDFFERRGAGYTQALQEDLDLSAGEHEESIEEINGAITMIPVSITGSLPADDIGFESGKDAAL